MTVAVVTFSVVKATYGLKKVDIFKIDFAVIFIQNRIVNEYNIGIKFFYK